MTLGVVGSEGAKFDARSEALARVEIMNLYLTLQPELVVSGGCHLGGIDIWAKEEAVALGIPFKEFLPKTRNWDGFKARNLQIARASDRVVCITVKALPPTYVAKGWEFFCYHCNTKDHIKSGGCWTVKQALKMHKLGDIIVIPEETT